MSGIWTHLLEPTHLFSASQLMGLDSFWARIKIKSWFSIHSLLSKVMGVKSIIFCFPSIQNILQNWLFSTIISIILMLSLNSFGASSKLSKIWFFKVHFSASLPLLYLGSKLNTKTWGVDNLSTLGWIRLVFLQF